MVTCLSSIAARMIGRAAHNVHLSAADANGNQLDYLINFRGADIVEAVIATKIQREPRGEPVAYTDVTTREDMVLPDIDKAELVMFYRVQGAQPQQLVRSFAGPGPAPDCP